MNIEDIRKEYGEDVYAYRQEFAGAQMEKDGYSDEYVHFLEQKLTSDNSEHDLKDVKLVKANLKISDYIKRGEIMDKIQRYDMIPEDPYVYVEPVNDDDGEWVKYDEIKHLLDRTTNSEDVKKCPDYCTGRYEGESVDI